MSNSSEENNIASPELRVRKGRGTLSRRDGRYEELRYESVDDGWGSLDEEPPPLRTTVAKDTSRTVIARNRSPDVPFEQSINPYRGCEHGCVYCYARPTHAYLGLSPGLDFESRLFAKPNAGRLLEAELRKPSYRCKVIGLGTNTDPYQPIERKFKITRRILEVLSAYNHPVTIVTKSALVERDIDILADMATRGLAYVTLSLTTLDRGLSRRMEPRAAAPQRRLETLANLAEADIPTGALIAPVIPGLNDAEIEKLVIASAQNGVCSARYIMVRLPLEISELFQEWLAAHYSLKKDRVMALIREMRGGRDNDPRFGTRMTGTGNYAAMIERRFRLACKQQGLNRDVVLNTDKFRLPDRSGDQLTLFDSQRK